MEIQRAIESVCERERCGEREYSSREKGKERESDRGKDKTHRMRKTRVGRIEAEKE